MPDSGILDGSGEDTGNYRPISALPVLSKVLERHVAVALGDHLHRFVLMYNLQSASHENHSTETALIKSTDKLLFNTLFFVRILFFWPRH